MRFFRSVWFRLLLGVGVLAGIAAAVAAVSFYLVIVRDLPDFHSLEDYQPALTSRVFDRAGRPIGEFFEERRTLVPLDRVPRHVVMAFVAGEDETFYEHEGIDYVSILRAAWINLVAGDVRQGASTITQQMAKGLLLSPERTYTRKLKELVLAQRVERRFSKQEILYLYLNQIYFGSGAYGIAEAARTYFGKDVGELTVSEAALLAGLPKAPSKYSPRVDPVAAEGRRQYVLAQMLDEGVIDAGGYEAARSAPPPLAEPPGQADSLVAAYFTEEVRRALYEALGSETVLRGGLRVETTLDLRLQHPAVSALRTGLEALDRRQGYRGPDRQVAAAEIDAEAARLAQENGLLPGPDGAPPPLPEGRELLAVVTEVRSGEKLARVRFAPGVDAEVHLADVSWARTPNPAQHPAPVTAIDRVFRVGDVARFERLPAAAPEGGPDAAVAPAVQPLRVGLSQAPAVQGALFCLEVATGEVLALVGGYDYAGSEFDRAVQARRQPGSAFKPLVYAAALTKGWTPVSIVYDRPVVYDDPSGQTWRPENYGREFLGPLTLREALARSVNNATVHLFQDVGMDYVIDVAQRVGIESPLDRNLSLALGSNAVSLFELTRAYATFAAGGLRRAPRFVRRVLDRDGKVLVESLGLSAYTPPPVATGPGAGSADPAADGRAPDGAERVLEAADAYLATDLLRAVVQDPKGTGASARKLGRPLAGKTGTTNDGGDAWFIGFSPRIVAGVWVGYDQKRVLGKGETGGRAALPIWIDYMEDALAEHPVEDFPVPDGIVFARIDRKSGLLADATSRDTLIQAFREGTEPTASAAAAAAVSETRRRLRFDY